MLPFFTGEKDVFTRMGKVLLHLTPASQVLTLHPFYIVRGEESPLSMTFPNPPPLIHHLNVFNDVLKIKGDITIINCVCACACMCVCMCVCVCVTCGWNVHACVRYVHVFP